MRCLVVVLALAGCQNSLVGSGDDIADAAPEYQQTLPGGPCSTGDVTGTLPGVTIRISSQSCVYHRGQPATFDYEVVVDAAVPTIDVPATSTCDCSSRSTQLATWVHWEIGGTSAGGAPQRYCLCDTGCCAPQPAQSIQPELGTMADSIEWSGRVWEGPSDTGNEPGGFFALGPYAVTVELYGFDHGEVRAQLPIEILP